ncbi:histidine kinase [Bacillus manliponensis]|uniref:Circadian input-output histidine kinase CikA n=1 Tax=Bacillus manliponensis TaxID=574376 RepID=A0A073JY70_9BACI|nr:ATP-binding protein [Bacillus manliponensis]KEK19177.1 histidine kinase [Bacillus manliponensis]
MKQTTSIRYKIMAGYLMIIFFLLISFILLNSQISSLQKSRNYIVDHDFKVHSLTNRLEVQLLTIESNAQAFIVSDNQHYLNAIETAEKDYAKYYNSLLLLISNNPSQQQKLKHINTTSTNWIKETIYPMIESKKVNDVQSPNDSEMKSLQTKLTEFRTTEEQLTKERAAQLDKKNERITTILYSLLLLLACISILTSTFISNSIIKTIKDVIQAIKGMSSKGKVTQKIQVKTNDEINHLAEATNDLLEEFQNREWFQTQIAELILMYQGISSIDTFGQKVLGGLIEKTKASFGAFYLREETENGIYYIKKASFADQNAEVGKQSFKIGEGLIGQCALEKKNFILNEIPDDFRLISSGLVEVRPKNLFIIPILFEDEVIAVIELASITEISDLHQDLIQQILDNLGLTIHSIVGRMRIQTLLHESQTMTEELQAQSEELQTQSEELQMQSEELKTINEQLESRTEEAEQKSMDLQLAKNELEDQARALLRSSKYKSEFLANMSHELRTPLNSILILSEMLMDNNDRNLSNEEVELANVIHSSGKDLLSLINDILDLSKVEAGKLDVIFNEMSISELPIKMRRTFSPVAEQKNLQFHITEDCGTSDIFYTDEKRIEQIMKNLLSNAFKFTEGGAVSLYIKRIENDEVHGDMRAISTDWLIISVTDTGIGIAKEQHKLIFEAFQQADGATIRKYGGTGLGLSICKEFAKLLGGWITLDSQLGKGSTFTVYIPNLPDGPQHQSLPQLESAATIDLVNAPTIDINATPNNVVEETPFVSEDNHIFQGKTILIVDDDHRNIFALQNALQNQQTKVITAQNGVECLEILKDNQSIDLILMDIMMPNMDGYETMEIIRTDLGLKELPIIALTAKAMQHDKEKCLASGASDYISKPLNLHQLYSVMRVWLLK